MSNHKTLARLALAALILTPALSAQAQTYSKQAELELAATGDTFRIGSRSFRFAPTAVPAPVSSGTDASRDVVVAGYEVTVPAPAPAAGARSKRDVGAASASAVAASSLGVAVADDGGRPVLVTQQLDVYVSDIGVVAALARDTGGTVTYASALGGNAVIKYPSAQAALTAMKRIQGQAGVKEVSPEIIESEIMSR